MVLELAERFEAHGCRYSLYEGDRWLLFREHGASAVCVGSIAKSGLGLIVNAWAQREPMVIVQRLEEAVAHLVAIDAPAPVDVEESSRPPLTEVETADATRTRA
jgi:hypothetical protein